MNLRPALFLDRDGVINVDHGYVCKRNDFEFIGGIFDLCRTAKRLGYMIFVVTNQAGIGRGYYTERDFLELSDWMCGVFREEGVEIDKVYFCPFHPKHGVGSYKVDSCDRKPEPGLILRAAGEFGIDLARSVLVGDKETDIKAGIAAGVGYNVLYRPANEVHGYSAANIVISDFAEVEAIIHSVMVEDSDEIVFSQGGQKEQDE